MKPIIRRYDGIVATRFEQGSDGTCAMYLVDAQDATRKRRLAGMMPAKAPELIGWSGDAYADPERAAAIVLIKRLQFYAERIRIEHGLAVEDVIRADGGTTPWAGVEKCPKAGDALAYAEKCK